MGDTKRYVTIAKFVVVRPQDLRDLRVLEFEITKEMLKQSVPTPKSHTKRDPAKEPILPPPVPEDIRKRYPQKSTHTARPGPPQQVPPPITPAMRRILDRRMN